MASWMTLIVLLAVTLAACLAQTSSDDETDSDDAVFLSPLIAEERFRGAKSKSRVNFDFVTNTKTTTLESYAGYITVNEAYGSNLFFWFFPAQNDTSTAPVLLWLNGGPGMTSMLGAMLENGPMKIAHNEGDYSVVEADMSWTESFSMLYVDNPVGVGYSFTRNSAGMSTTLEDVSSNLYSLLVQFFTLFHEYSQNDLYIGGQSYACKYIPALGRHIHNQNQASPSPSLRLPLRGAYIGGGLCNAEVMLPDFYDYFYYAGMMSDYSRRKYGDQLRDVITESVAAGRFDSENANRLFSGTTNVSIFANVEFMLGKEHSTFFLKKGLQQLLNESRIRTALHVGEANGNKPFLAWNRDIYGQVLPQTLVRNTDEDNVFLMENYKVLHYSGNMDLTVSVAATDKFLQQLQWSGSDTYRDSIYYPWFRLDPFISYGWFIQIGSFTRVIILNAGHQTPLDQPEAAFLMMKNFVFDQPFSSTTGLDG